MGRLSGRRILITRAHPGTEALAARLEALGAIAVVAPTIAVRPVDDPRDLQAQAARLTSGDWVVITSPTAARIWAALTRAHPSLARLAAIGLATAEVLSTEGLPVAFVGDRATGAALAVALVALGGTGQFLLPRSDKAVADLSNGLRAAGMTVIECELYQTVPRLWTEAEREAVGVGVDVVTLMSPSAVQGLLSQPGADAWLPGAKLVAMGPTTAAAVQARFGRLDGVAEPPSLEGLVDAICRVSGVSSD